MNFPQFVVIHTVRDFGVVNKADIFLELSCFLDDPMDVGNLISGSSAVLLFTALDFIYLFFLALDFSSISGYIHNWVLFFFGSFCSFVLELFLHWSLVAYWAPTDLGSSSFSVLSFCHFILFMGFSRQEYWSGLPFPSPVDRLFVRTLHHDLSVLGAPTWYAS